MLDEVSTQKWNLVREKVGKGPLNGDNGPQLEECGEIVFYSGSGWAAGRAQRQTIGLIRVQSLFAP